jgi:hypothetical protein
LKETFLSDQPIPDRPLSDPRGEDTRAVAHLPGLDIEIVHRRTAAAERISVHVQAVPSFEAFSRALQGGNPFAFWATAARMAWGPWLAGFGAGYNPWLVAPWLGATRALLPPEHVSDAPPTRPED